MTRNPLRPGSACRFAAALLLFAAAVPSRAALWEAPLAETEDGWQQSAWLGWIYPSASGWIYHEAHGWIYPVGIDEGSLWCWDLRLGWIWTGEPLYPFVYHATRADWLYYDAGTQDPRYLYSFAAEDWAALHALDPAPVTRSTEPWEWRHQTFTESPDHALLNFNATTSTRTFDLTVVENDWIRIKLLPDWGGRILSIYYKPLEYELLYYPRGGQTRSDMIASPGDFYYDWILLAYGINPTFPEGEHGKYWGVPWPLELIHESDAQVTFRMSMVDDVDWPGHPRKFNNGRTDLAVAMDVTVYRDRAYVDVEYTLTNTRNSAVAYEFWTPAAFAPTRLTDSRIPSASDIVMNHDRILVKDWWNWIWRTETDDGVPGDDIYQFDKLRRLANWQGSGIAYAYPVLEIPWFGVIDEDDGFGALRTADDPDAAPGMKIWASGSDYFMFELWSGHSPEFFLDSILEPLEVRQWHEFYLPFAGLTNVAHATKYGAVDVTLSSDGLREMLDLTLFGTVPADVWQISIAPLTPSGTLPPLATRFVSIGPNGGPHTLSLILPTADLPPDLLAWHFEITEAFSAKPRLSFYVEP